MFKLRMYTFVCLLCLMQFHDREPSRLQPFASQSLAFGNLLLSSLGRIGTRMQVGLDNGTKHVT